MAPPTRPTPAALDQQAAKLREQAAGLNREQADRTERVVAELGDRLDQANRAATSARADANEALEQAQALRTGSEGMVNEAKDLEAKAAKLAQSNGVGDRDMADDYREQAQTLLAKAAGRSQRAQQAERSARNKLQEAERADRDARQLRSQAGDEEAALQPLAKAADALESKATQLEDAAGDLRQAGKAQTATERARYTKLAEDKIGVADGIKPDYTAVDVDTMVRAGIPVSDKPGNELIDPFAPTSMAPTTSTGNDTDLMRPSDVPASTGNDTDLMQPGSGEGNDTDLMPPTGGSNGGNDTDLMRPDDLSGTTTDPLDDPLALGRIARPVAPVVGSVAGTPLATTDPLADPLADPLGGELRTGTGELADTGAFDGSADDLGLDGSGLAGDPAPVSDTAGFEPDTADPTDTGTTGGDPYVEAAPVDPVAADPLADPLADSMGEAYPAAQPDVGDAGAEVAYVEPSGEYVDDGGGYGGDTYGDASADAMSGEYS